MRACRPRWREGRRSTGKEREEKEARRDCEAQIRLRCCGNAGSNQSAGWICSEPKRLEQRCKGSFCRHTLNLASPIHHIHPRCAHNFLHHLCMYYYSWILLTSNKAGPTAFLVGLKLGHGQSSPATAFLHPSVGLFAKTIYHNVYLAISPIDVLVESTTRLAVVITGAGRRIDYHCSGSNRLRLSNPVMIEDALFSERVCPESARGWSGVVTAVGKS
jgi:hypothetical protein